MTIYVSFLNIMQEITFPLYEPPTNIYPDASDRKVLFGKKIFITNNDEFVLKEGHSVTMNEVYSMQCVSTFTTIPIPKLFNWGKSPTGRPFILMSFEPGKPLSDVWESMDEEGKTKVVQQLEGYVSQLHRIQKPSQCEKWFACASNGGPLSCQVLFLQLSQFLKFFLNFS
jgi:hypothetical protein